MSERAGAETTQRIVDLTEHKLGPAAKAGLVGIGAVALAAAGSWAVRRHRFERAAQPLRELLSGLESAEPQRRQLLARQVLAANLVYPAGLDRDELRQVLGWRSRSVPGFSETVRQLVASGALAAEHPTKVTVQLRPQRALLLTLLDEPEATPRLLATARELQPEFDYQQLRPYAGNTEVLDQTPLLGGPAPAED